jgi:hypothetical protein
MSETTAQDVRARGVVYTIADAERVRVRQEIAFGDGLVLDLYHPPDIADDVRVPAVIIVAGYPDPGFQRRVGCRFKDMASSRSWSRLIAASGMAAITYTNIEPVRDLERLFDHIRDSDIASELAIDEHRLGLWASSGNVPLALSSMMNSELRCAALCYGYMLDLDGSTTVDDIARTFGFAAPNAGRTMDDLRADAPLFLARAGQDQMPGLNETLDRFVLEALRRNLPITLANHANGPHAFDLFDDSDASRAVVRQILLFLRSHI